MDIIDWRKYQHDNGIMLDVHAALLAQSDYRAMGMSERRLAERYVLDALNLQPCVSQQSATIIVVTALYLAKLQEKLNDHEDNKHREAW